MKTKDKITSDVGRDIDNYSHKKAMGYLMAATDMNIQQACHKNEKLWESIGKIIETMAKAI